MTEILTMEQINRAADAVREKIDLQPEIGMILGSGLGSLAESVSDPIHIPYTEIPGWPTSTVVGHAGRLVIGRLEDKKVLVMQGRVHYYEGYSIVQVGLPVRVMQALGVHSLVVTNAAGAVNPDFVPGDLMLITDHVNLPGMAGLNPLYGPNLDEFGPRVPDMSQAYDRKYASMDRQAAREAGITLREGVYIFLSGPSFESPADLRFLRGIGADAVGLSTVPEVIVARHGGMRVLGISGISNKANLDGETITTHEEVLEAGEVIVPKLTTILRRVLRQM